MPLYFPFQPLSPPGILHIYLFHSLTCWTRMWVLGGSVLLVVGLPAPRTVADAESGATNLHTGERVHSSESTTITNLFNLHQNPVKPGAVLKRNLRHQERREPAQGFFVWVFFWLGLDQSFSGTGQGWEHYSLLAKSSLPSCLCKESFSGKQPGARFTYCLWLLSG